MASFAKILCSILGRLHTKKESPLGHVILTLIFVDPYRLFHTIYKAQVQQFVYPFYRFIVIFLRTQ